MMIDLRKVYRLFDERNIDDHTLRINSYKVELLIEAGMELTLIKHLDGLIKNSDTLFKEIGVIPFEDRIDTNLKKELQLFRYQSCEINEDKFIDDFIEKLEKEINDNWNPDKFNIIFITNDCNTRLFCGMLKRLEMGGKKLGNFIFVCMDYTVDNVIPVMKYLGWDHRVHRYHGNVENDLQFEMAWRAVNGVAVYPHNYLYHVSNDVAEWYELKSAEEVQVWNLNYLSTIFDYQFIQKFEGNVLRFLESFYYGDGQFYSALLFPMKYVLLDTEFLKFLFESNIDLTADLRNAILRRLDSNLLDISNSNIKIDEILNYDFRKRIFEEYKLSWYGQWHDKHVNMITFDDVPDKLNPCNFWYHWTAASWCEYLKGVSIKIKV